MDKKRVLKWAGILALALIGCLILSTRNHKGETSPSLRRLSFLHFHIEYESRYPLTWPRARQFSFYRGWGKDTSLPQATRTPAVIRFFNRGKKDKSLFLSLENPNPAPTGKNLALSVGLNRQFLERIRLGKAGDFLLSLPAGKLKKGENFLHLEVDDHPWGPKRFTFHDPGVWFLVKDIHFTDIGRNASRGETFLNLQKSSDSLYQPANSCFKIAVDTDETHKLLFKFKPQHPGKGSSRLTVRKKTVGKGWQDVLTLDPKISTSRKGEIPFPETGRRIILEFDFVSPTPDAFLVWEGVALVDRNREPPPTSLPSTGLKPLGFKPHIFLVLIDAARFDLVGREFEGKPATPHINRFSRTAHHFLHFYANAPYTGPSVASTLTGYLPEAHGVRNPGSRLPGNLKTLPLYLREAGYQTAAVVGNVILLDHDLVRHFHRVVFIRPPAGDTSRQKTSFNDIDRAVGVIRDLETASPQFVYFHFLPPHFPYVPPGTGFRLFRATRKTGRDGPSREYLHRLKPSPYFDPAYIDSFYRAYLDNAHYADFLVGQIIAALKERGIFKDALVVVASDHGEAFGEHAQLYHTTTNYEEMLRVPFLVKFPRQEQKILVREPASLVDLLPSLAVLLHFPLNESWQGRPFLLDSPPSIESPRLIYARAGGDQWHCALFDRHHRYIFNAGRDELYCLETDPGERHNLSAKNPFLALYLKQELFRRLRRNLELKKVLKIGPEEPPGRRRELERELRTLGYIK